MDLCEKLVEPTPEMLSSASDGEHVINEETASQGNANASGGASAETEAPKDEKQRGPEVPVVARVSKRARRGQNRKKTKKIAQKLLKQQQGTLGNSVAKP